MGRNRNFVVSNQTRSIMPHPLVSKFSSSFLDFRESVIQNLFLLEFFQKSFSIHIYNGCEQIKS